MVLNQSLQLVNVGNLFNRIKVNCVFLVLVIQELSEIRTFGVKNFRNIQVDETNILCWQGLIVPVSTKLVLTKQINADDVSIIFLTNVYFHRTVLLMKREHSGLSSPSLQTTLSSPQRSRSRQKSTILTLMKKARCVCQSLVLKTGSQPQKLTKVRDGNVSLMWFMSFSWQESSNYMSAPT